MVWHPVLFQPLDGRGAMALVATGAQDDLDPGIVQNIAEPYHGLDGSVLRHALEEGLPILGFFLQMMDALGDVGERAIDIEQDDFFGHRSLLSLLKAGARERPLHMQREEIDYV